jgi:hypothetical protein
MEKELHSSSLKRCFSGFMRLKRAPGGEKFDSAFAACFILEFLLCITIVIMAVIIIFLFYILFLSYQLCCTKTVKYVGQDRKSLLRKKLKPGRGNIMERVKKNNVFSYDLNCLMNICLCTFQYWELMNSSCCLSQFGLFDYLQIYYLK